MDELPTHVDLSMHPTLYNGSRTQQKIGWETLLFIFFGYEDNHPLINHFTYIESRKSENRYGIELITRIWTIIQSHYIHINQTLHETIASVRLHGVNELKTTIIREYELGLGKLYMSNTSYFLLPLSFILDKPTPYIRMCFQVVRSGRESCTIDIDIYFISTDKTLRAWVELCVL